MAFPTCSKLPHMDGTFVNSDLVTSDALMRYTASQDRTRIVFNCRMADDPTMISSNACIGRHLNMQRKTAFEVLSTGDSVEIHSWLRTATVKELSDALEAVKRHDTWGSHVRDALDIRVAANSQRTANLVLALTSWR